jgi:hypothetical protein
MKTFEKADRALAEGSLWRAREILEGSIPNLGYNLQLYERLGLVLLREQNLRQRRPDESGAAGNEDAH